ncbi:hypothetical protein LAZ67_21001887 [Cordylochernes scorpioides]|uniref:Acyl-CoA dehydrogenase 6 n=1 Tax=Cordylochernes scorpioides TaxID=51811 RepID=A0ABY6LQ01_9ARAC|nr:hypothetical protein LAZ67_21001887 [Cordylochernes scorpioides]
MLQWPPILAKIQPHQRVQVTKGTLAHLEPTAIPEVHWIVEKDINPYVDQWEEEHIYPAKKVFKKFGEAGLLGITRSTAAALGLCQFYVVVVVSNEEPQMSPYISITAMSSILDYGGLGLDYTYTVAFMEALGLSCKCSGVPMSIMVHTDCSTPALANFGSDELKKQFLTPSIAGEVVSAVGISEPGGGSDVASIRTKAERRGDDLVINGEKMWITNGCQADWICLLANTSQGPPHKNKSLICVPMDTPGVKVLANIKKIGNHSSDTGHLFFDDVRVPAKYIIGEEGQGFTYQMLQFQEERLAGTILALSGMDSVIQETINYTRQRQIFGAPVLNNQVVHFTLAELQTEVECLRALLYQAAGQMVKGENVTLLASMAKLKAGKLSREVADKCLQYWGGMGYSDETIVSRFYRDSRLISIGGGADEVMISIICKLLGTLPKPKKS